MPLSPEEASLHLDEAQTTLWRSARAYSYAAAAPHLILWGVIWVIGYLATALFPPAGLAVWMGLIVCGSIGSAYFGRRAAGRYRSDVAGKSGQMAIWRLLALVLSIFTFMTAVYAIFGPPTDMQVAAFPPLLVGQAYICIGLFGLGTRIAVTGAGIFALTLLGYFLLAPYFLIWMAFVGGGALIAGGLWLRKV